MLLSKNNIGFFVAFSTAFLFVTVIPPKGVLYLFIVLGQAHFLITYFYTNKAGKINSLYLKRFALLVGLLGIACYLLFYNEVFTSSLIFITLVLFTAHYFNDEIKIGLMERPANALLATLSVLLAFAGLFLSLLFSVNSFLLYVVALGSLISGILFIYKYFSQRARSQRNISFVLFLLANIVVPLALTFTVSVDIHHVAGFIILFHYIRWYIYYYFRFSGEDRNFYLDVIMWSHLLLFLLFFAYILAPHISILYMLFSPTFFYGWTIVHILLSIRKGDYLSYK